MVSAGVRPLFCHGDEVCYGAGLEMSFSIAQA